MAGFSSSGVNIRVVMSDIAASYCNNMAGPQLPAYRNRGRTATGKCRLSPAPFSASYLIRGLLVLSE
jgi:hypothetical protein